MKKKELKSEVKYWMKEHTHVCKVLERVYKDKEKLVTELQTRKTEENIQKVFNTLHEVVKLRNEMRPKIDAEPGGNNNTETLHPNFKKELGITMKDTVEDFVDFLSKHQSIVDNEEKRRTEIHLDTTIARLYEEFKKKII